MLCARSGWRSISTRPRRGRGPAARTAGPRSILAERRPCPSNTISQPTPAGPGWGQRWPAGRGAAPAGTGTSTDSRGAAGTAVTEAVSTNRPGPTTAGRRRSAASAPPAEPARPVRRRKRARHPHDWATIQRCPASWAPSIVDGTMAPMPGATAMEAALVMFRPAVAATNAARAGDCSGLVIGRRRRSVLLFRRRQSALRGERPSTMPGCCTVSSAVRRIGVEGGIFLSQLKYRFNRRLFAVYQQSAWTLN